MHLLLPEKVASPAEKILRPLKDRRIQDVRDLVKRIGKIEQLGIPVTIYPDAEEYIHQVLYQDRVRKKIEQIRKDPKNHPLRTSLLKTELLPYQLDGIAFAAGAGRAIIADDMGLGKTIQGIGVAELLSKDVDISRVLIVCPASLKSQWRLEIKRFSDLKTLLQSADRWEGERIGHRRSGELYPQWMQLAVVRDSSGTISHYVGFFADLSVHRQTEAQLQYLTTHDALTQLANRNMFTQRLQEATSRARQTGSTLALMHVDLDRFKYINDTLGHKVADELLQQVARRLRELTPESDSLARLSADEFVIIIEHDTQQAQLEQRANQVLEVLRQPVTIGEHELIITASVGLSQFPKTAHDNLLLITQANQAMQHAKHLGGNGFQFFTDNLQACGLDRLQLENQLRKALEDDQLVVHYQPKLHLATDQIGAAEALVRWQHPERGLVMPAQFIDIAEETGMIIALGDAVLVKACQQASEWYHYGPTPIRVAVNLSVQQLRQTHFAERIAQILANVNLPAEMLELELTESMLLEHLDAVTENLASLQAMGITLAIDDFGTGYSSLAYLKRFPISTLKIDRAFISELNEFGDDNAADHDAAIVRAIIAMAHSLNMMVVAEGVETAGQLNFLKRHGCDEVQGYLISRPLAASGVTALLVEHAEAQVPVLS
ncbi:MAG: EAL domain-containing protein [Halopseudomonas sp.]